MVKKAPTQRRIAEFKTDEIALPSRDRRPQPAKETALKGLQDQLENLRAEQAMLEKIRHHMMARIRQLAKDREKFVEVSNIQNNNSFAAPTPVTQNSVSSSASESLSLKVPYCFGEDMSGFDKNLEWNRINRLPPSCEWKPC